LTEDTNDIPDVDIANLVDNQRRIFLRIVEHYRLILDGENPPPLRINVDGTAGTGKPYLIDAISKALAEMAMERGKKSPVLRLAPTGVAAFNIHGATVHSSLSLPVRGEDRLTSDQLLQLQGRLGPIEYIILDEKSMVGQHFYPGSIQDYEKGSFNRTRFSATVAFSCLAVSVSCLQLATPHCSILGYEMEIVLQYWKSIMVTKSIYPYPKTLLSID
jgi:hypothetical protein